MISKKRIKKLAKYARIKLVHNVPLVGIYSFPKSGNTWVRHIISSIYFNGFDNGNNNLANVPDMHMGPIADARSCKIGNGTSIKFYKSHCAEIAQRNFGMKLNHYGIVYITRHPLDVFLSYLNYICTDVRHGRSKNYLIPIESVEQIVANGSLEILLDTFILYGTLQPEFTAPRSWFENMQYWTRRDFVEQDGRKIPVVCLRYEDMVSDGAKAMQPLCDILGLSEKQVGDTLSVAEEKTRIDGKFFWKQKPGLYTEVLPEDLIAKFRKHHGERVAALGYEV